MRSAVHHPCTVLLALLLLAPVNVSAQELVAGWEGQTGRGYAFVAPGFEAVAAGNQRVIFRAVASFLYYEYPDEEARIRVRSPGAGASVGYRIATARVSFTIAPGLELRRTSRQRGSATGSTTEFGGTLQAEVFAQVTPRMRGSVIASYGHANRYTWVRGAVIRQLSNVTGTDRLTVSGGLEVTGQGNADARSTQVGGVLELALPRSAFSAQLRGGLAVNDGSTRHPYFGVGMYRRF